MTSFYAGKMAQEKEKPGDQAAKYLEKLKIMKEEFTAKLDAVFEKGGISPQMLDKFLDNPHNFSEKQWQFIQEQRELYKKKLIALVGKKELEQHEKKLKKKVSTERSRKTLGGRKKWIPMR